MCLFVPDRVCVDYEFVSISSPIYCIYSCRVIVMCLFVPDRVCVDYESVKLVTDCSV